jgi:Tol biopolymer transport system component
MLLPRRFPRLTVALAISTAAIACGGEDVTVPPTTGTLEITTSTSGAEQDADGYSVQIDAEAPRSIAAAGTLTASEITAGNHTVQLGEVAANCTVSGDNPRTISVTAGGTTTISFAVTCIATTGMIRVSVTTSGSPTDPDGYVTKLDGSDPGLAIGTIGNVSFTGVLSGSHTVALTGLAANCSVTGGPSQTTTVSVGGTSDITFVVTCTPTTGSIQLTTHTTGSSRDANGYTLSVDGTASQVIGLNETRALEGLGVGTHAITLSGIANNCHLDGVNPRMIDVVPGSTSVTFDLNCLGPDALIAFFSNAIGLSAIFVVRPDGTGLRSLTPDGTSESNPVWSPDGRKILFSKPEGLYVMDAQGSGKIKLADDAGGYTWSSDGRMIAYVVSRHVGQDIFEDLWVMHADGSNKLQLAANATNPSWSPDGRRIAYWHTLRIHIVNADGTGDVRLTNRLSYAPSWSPDGTRIAFVTFDIDLPAGKDMFLINPDGTGEVNLTQGVSEDEGPTWSPDGSKIAFVTFPAGQQLEGDIAVMNRDGSNRVNLTNRPGFDVNPDWSPDGSKIVFQRSENDNSDSEIYVMNADGSNQLNLSNRPDSYESVPDWNGRGSSTVAGRQSSAYNIWLRAHGLETIEPRHH